MLLHHGPPNILVYTPTYLGDVQGNEYNNIKTYHILNTIGLALDNDKQPDLIILKKLGVPNKINGVQEGALKKFYRLLFTNIFRVAFYLKKKNLIMSLVGAGNFANEYPGGTYKPTNEQLNQVGNDEATLEAKAAFEQERTASNRAALFTTIWKPMFEQVLTELKTEITNNELTIYFMGSGKISAKFKLPTTNQPIKDLGRFPDLLKETPIIGYENETLLVNAWDCWSVPGNGNGADDSLDGFIGRRTNIGVVGTSLTNPYLKMDENYIPFEQ